MKLPLIVFILILIWTSALTEIVADRLIVWNVGQGLWITLARSQSCTHIDMGGEKINWKKLTIACGNKQKNFALFTHWDLDHISFAERASRRLPGFCVVVLPRGPAIHQRVRTFAKFKLCPEEETEILEVPFSVLQTSKRPNDHSRVFKCELALFPGDSTAKQERLWSQQILQNKFKFLVLGHHGSKTSTTINLLKRLPELRLAIASARKKRYGHPHRSVVDNLHNFGVALLSTEQWNNIVIEIK